MMLRCLHSTRSMTRLTQSLAHTRALSGPSTMQLTSTYCSAASGSATMTDGERKIADLLRARFTTASQVHVQDISGGCGAQYQVLVHCPEFAGQSLLKQHRMIKDTLKDEIKEMHAIRIQTSDKSN